MDKRWPKTSIVNDAAKRRAVMRFAVEKLSKVDDGRVSLLAAMAFDEGYEAARRRFARASQMPRERSMSKWKVKVRVVAEVNYLTPPGNMNEEILRRQAQHKIQAMAAKLEKHVEQMLADQINAEIDLARASHS